VDWSCDGQTVQSRVCQQDHDTACVGIGVGTTNQAFVNEPGDPPGHAGTGDEGPVRQLCHPQRTTSARQLSEHVEVGQRQTGLAFEIGLKLAQERGVGPEQCAPRLQPAPARHLFRDDPIEVSRGVGFGQYLHMQPPESKVFASASIREGRGRRLRMINELEVGLDRSLRRRWGTMADDVRVKRTIAALEANGINVLRASDAATAKRMVLNLIPEGSQVHHGASQTLDVVGITDEIDKSGRYGPLRPRIWSMDRKTEGDEIRRLGAAPDVMLGSVHAVTETGSLLTASMSGSQLGPYSSGAGRVILVVGTQKIVSDLEEGLHRIDEYAYPLEDARAQAAYGIRSAVNKVLVINREITPGRITVVLVDEVLGF